MKRFLLLTLALALVPAFSPAEASSLTLAQRVTKLEAKLKCVVKTPVTEFANYGDPVVGQNASNVFVGDPGEAPDQLTDVANTFALDWDFGNPTPNLWVLNVKADNEGFVSSTCAKLFPKQVASAVLLRTRNERLMRARQLARVR